MSLTDRRRHPHLRGVQRHHLVQGGALFVVLFLLLIPSLRTTRSRAALGEPLPVSVYAPTGFVYKDEALARERWTQAERADAVVLQVVSRSRRASLERDVRDVISDPALLAGRILPEHAALLTDPARRERIRRVVDTLLARIDAYGIYQSVASPDQRYRIQSLGEARIVLGRDLLTFDRLEEHLRESGADEAEARALSEVFRLRYLPTLIADEEAWIQTTAKIRAEIPVPEIRPEPGTLLIPSGKSLTEADLRLLEALAEYQRKGRLLPALGLATYLLLGLFLVAVYLRKYLERSWTMPRHTAALALGIGATAVAVFAVGEIVRSLPPVDGFHLTPAIWPVSLGAFALALFFGARAAFLATTILSFGFVLAYAPRVEIATMFLLGNLIAAREASRVRRRADLVRAAGITALGHTAVLLCVALIRGLEPHLVAEDVVSAILGPFLAASAVHPLLSALEWCSGKASVFRLLELTDLDHPTLRRMLREAPGTFQHSQHVALLAEAAADAIGARSLLCRVGGYFHDLGNLRRPEYFTENARTGQNPHDDLKPNLSAEILKAHVSDGLEEGRGMGLPEEVLSFIPEHHGTSMMEFFYYKALQESGEDAVDRFAYTYDGPRPQTRETAVLMLADSVEAACRTLEKPSIGKIERTVRKIVNQKFVDGQLDESPLTLSDLNKVAEAFSHVLAGMYHARSVDYPEKEEIRRAEEGRGDA